MSKVEKFIHEHTKTCDNLLYRDYIGGFNKTIYHPWLTPDDARKAAGIAREENIKDILHKLSVFLDNKDDRDYYTVGYIKRHFEDLKKYLEDKK